MPEFTIKTDPSGFVVSLGSDAEEAARQRVRADAAADRAELAEANAANAAGIAVLDTLTTLARAGEFNITDVPGSVSFATTSAEVRFTEDYYRFATVFADAFEDHVSVSFARTGAGLARNRDGYEYFLTGVPRITDQGLKVGKASYTNKLGYSNAAPTTTTSISKTGDAAAIFGLVDDPTLASAVDGGGKLLFADLIAAGVMNGKAYKLDNSAGTGVAAVTFTLSQTGNTNSHTLDAYWRGSGSGALRYSSNSVPAPLTVPTDWARVSQVLVPSLSTSTFRVQASAGAVVYFILFGMYEGLAPTEPVIVAGTPATIGADVITLDLPPGADDDVVTVKHTAGVVSVLRSDLASPTSFNLGTSSAGAWIGEHVESVTVLPARKPRTYILVAAGQSNMVGADGPAVSVTFPTDNDDILEWHLGAAIAAVEPLHWASDNSSYGESPAMHCARRLRDRYNAQQVIVLSSAQGGTGLVVPPNDDWAVGGSLRIAMMTEIAEALAAYPDAEVIVLWSQGENDVALDGSDYSAAEIALFEEIRTIAPAAKIVIGGMVPEYRDGNPAYRQTIEEVHRDTAAALPGVAYVQGPRGVSFDTNNIHYANAAQEIRGFSWADQWAIMPDIDA